MSAPSFPDFYSKILLFGEYSLMYGSMALSMPTDKYKGRLSFAKEEQLKDKTLESNRALLAFAESLEKLAEKNALGFRLDTGRLFEDISKGLFFESNIPQGYGLGSSGALVAAVFSAYAEGVKTRSESFSQEEITTLKNDFSSMESFFHGKSSGLDPLICFLQKPILVENKESLRTVNIPDSSRSGKAGVFLLDSGAPGETQPLVNLFVDKCKDEKYFDRITRDLIPLNHQCIQAFLDADNSALLNHLKDLSQFTLDNLSPMVPSPVTGVWKQGLETEDFFLKLCGSGGGGMLLGFTADMEKAKLSIQDFNIEVIRTL